MNDQDNIRHLVALGNPGGNVSVGLETFPNPGVTSVTLNSDEFTAMCPLTGQPDQYEVTIRYEDTDTCIESKSLKLYLQGFRNQGIFVEALAVQIKKDVLAALEHEEDRDVEVTIIQKRRGGIEIEATA